MPAFDLRTSAKVVGNRPYLPTHMKLVVAVSVTVAVVALLTIGACAAWGLMLRMEVDDVDLQLAELKTRQIKQGRVDWIGSWETSTMHMQPSITRLLEGLPPTIYLSQLTFRNQDEKGEGEVGLEAIINGDPVSAAGHFGQIRDLLQQEGLTMRQIDVTRTSGGTRFIGMFRRAMQARASASTNAPPAGDIPVAPGDKPESEGAKESGVPPPPPAPAITPAGGDKLPGESP